MSQKLFHSLTKPEVTGDDSLKLTTQSKASTYDISKNKLDLDQPVNQLNRIIDELRKSNEENIDMMKQTLSEELNDMQEKIFWKWIWNETSKNNINTWDYQWGFACSQDRDSHGCYRAFG